MILPHEVRLREVIDCLQEVQGLLARYDLRPEGEAWSQREVATMCLGTADALARAATALAAIGRVTASRAADS